MDDLTPAQRLIARANAGRMIKPTKPNLLATLVELGQEHERLLLEMDVYVAKARHAGATWEEVGRSLGMSKQAAQKRWARLAQMYRPADD